MTTNETQSVRRRWIWWVIVALIILALVALAVSEAYRVYYGGRSVQNAVEFSAYLGLGQLALELQQPVAQEDQVEAAMTRGVTLGEIPNSHDVVGTYLDAAGRQLGAVGEGVPQGAEGLRVTIHAQVPTPLTRLLGLAGWPVERQAEFSLRPE